MPGRTYPQEGVAGCRRNPSMTQGRAPDGETPMGTPRPEGTKDQDGRPGAGAPTSASPSCPACDGMHTHVDGQGVTRSGTSAPQYRAHGGFAAALAVLPMPDRLCAGRTPFRPFLVRIHGCRHPDIDPGPGHPLRSALGHGGRLPLCAVPCVHLSGPMMDVPSRRAPFPVPYVSGAEAGTIRHPFATGQSANGPRGIQAASPPHVAPGHAPARLPRGTGRGVQASTRHCARPERRVPCGPCADHSAIPLHRPLLLEVTS
jgi:hypothetical protein